MKMPKSQPHPPPPDPLRSVPTPARAQNVTGGRGLGCAECKGVARTWGWGVIMNSSVVIPPTAAASTSPYRVRDHKGGELDWANAFLDSQRLRQLSLRSLRI